MKIALDMQSRQTTGSRDRGIGRYSLSLARAMLRQGQQHTFSILLNGVFDRTIDLVKADFEVEQDDPRIQIYQTLPHSTEWTRDDAWRHKASEYLRESFLAAKEFDFVHCTSLFESPMDDSSTSWGHFPNAALHGVTLYDLIPYAFPETYLTEAPMRTSYLRKIQDLRKADLLLSISEFSRREAIERLGIDPGKVVNISGAADDRFQKIAVSPNARERLLRRHGLGRFIMYTGGIDYRKNIERLIQAYAQLAPALIAEYQLVIVCSVQPYQRDALLRQAAAHGLAPDRLVMTGFVSDDDLVTFYNLCDLFVFPSWCEGFGLPALEAMQCGAPVIAAGTSSLPEVMGMPEALFDPYSLADIADCMTRGLTDQGFRSRLIQHGQAHARTFTWDRSAAIGLAAMEEAHARGRAGTAVMKAGKVRPKLAFVSPLPPSKSGIASYSAQLLPVLDEHYEITLICKDGRTSDTYLEANFAVKTPQWLRENAARFDRVVYQFGNSDHHDYMFRLLELVPGTVVLHDFWLSHVLEYIQLFQSDPHIWDEHLHYSHGWTGLAQRRGGADDIPVVNRFPCNKRVIESAVGVILHSDNSARLAAEWYGEQFLESTSLVNHLRAVATHVDKPATKAALGLPQDELLICSFGFIHSSKHSLRLAQAFMATDLSRQRKARLILVGQNADGEYGDEIARIVAQSEGRVSFTGFASDADYRLYLQAADAAVQLRGVSRGETSGAALDCLAHDVVLAINDNGAFSQIPQDAVVKLPAQFDDAELVGLLDSLFADPDRLQQLRAAGRNYLSRECSPAMIAARYRDAIEHFHAHHPVARREQVVGALAGISVVRQAGVDDLESAVTAVVHNFPSPAPVARIYIDQRLVQTQNAGNEQHLRALLVDNAAGPRCELLRLEAQQYFNATDAAASLLGVDAVQGPALHFDPRPSDVIVLDGESLLAHDEHSVGAHRLLRDVRLSRARLLLNWSDLEGSLATHGTEQVVWRMQPALLAASSVIVESESAARFIADQVTLARKSFGGKLPEVLYPSASAGDRIMALCVLAAQGQQPGEWQSMPAPGGTVHAWPAQDNALISQMGQLREGFYHSDGKEGFLVYGPYAAIQPGTYQLRVLGSLAQHPEGPAARFEVGAEKGRLLLAQGELANGHWSLADTLLVLDKPVQDLEIRIWANAFSRMAFRGYYLARCQPAPSTGDTE